MKTRGEIMKKVVHSLLVSLCLLAFPLSVYANPASKSSSIFGGDMDDLDDTSVFIGNPAGSANELAQYFSGLWESLSQNERSAIMFSGDGNYLYTNTTISDGHSAPPVTYYGKYVIRGDREEGSIEVTFNNGDYIAFPYEMCAKDKYLIDKRLYKKSTNNGYPNSSK